jgi:hypothetical protein
MKYAFALVLSVVCTLSIVAAQTPTQQAPATERPAQQQPAPGTPSAQTGQSAKVTYTGCLKPGTTADSWTLENAEVASAAGTSAKPSSAIGTSGAGSKTTLALTAKSAQNLKPHANHKIEVVGTVSPAGAGSTTQGAGATTQGAAATTPGNAGAASTASTTAPQQNLTVESFKMVSATCP